MVHPRDIAWHAFIVFISAADILDVIMSCDAIASCASAGAATANDRAQHDKSVVTRMAILLG